MPIQWRNDKCFNLWTKLFTYFSLVGVQNRISQGLKVLQYYTTKNWVFKNEKFLQMKEKMTVGDRKRFYFSVEEVKKKNVCAQRITDTQVKFCSPTLPLPQCYGYTICVTMYVFSITFPDKLGRIHRPLYSRCAALFVERETRLAATGTHHSAPPICAGQTCFVAHIRAGRVAGVRVLAQFCRCVRECFTLFERFYRSPLHEQARRLKKCGGQEWAVLLGKWLRALPSIESTFFFSTNHH